MPTASPAVGAGLSPNGARVAPRSRGRCARSLQIGCGIAPGADPGARHAACAKAGEAQHPLPGSGGHYASLSRIALSPPGHCAARCCPSGGSYPHGGHPVAGSFRLQAGCWPSAPGANLVGTSQTSWPLRRSSSLRSMVAITPHRRVGALMRGATATWQSLAIAWCGSQRPWCSTSSVTLWRSCSRRSRSRNCARPAQLATAAASRRANAVGLSRSEPVVPGRAKAYAPRRTWDTGHARIGAIPARRNGRRQRCANRGHSTRAPLVGGVRARVGGQQPRRGRCCGA